MRINASSILIQSLLVAGFGPNVVRAQNRPPAAEATAATVEATTGLAEQEELTGDWGGQRIRWKEKGLEFEGAVTQFYQGVVDGGIETGEEYNDTAEAGFELDLGKLAGWKYWSAEVKADMRFGGPLLGRTGTISPVNTAVIVPGADGEKATLSAVNLTRLFPLKLEEGKLFALSFGRFNLLDLLDEDFFAGAGTERFWNIAQIGPLTVLRQIPLITNMVNAAYIRGGEPFITFALIDPNDHSLDSGLSDAFEDGITFSPGVHPAREVLRQDRQALLRWRHHHQGVHAVRRDQSDHPAGSAGQSDRAPGRVVVGQLHFPPVRRRARQERWLGLLQPDRVRR